MYFIYFTSILFILLQLEYINSFCANKISMKLYSSSISFNNLDFPTSMFVKPLLKRVWNPGIKPLTDRKFKSP